MALVPLSWSSTFLVVLLLILLSDIAVAFISLPIEKILKHFLQGVQQDPRPCVPWRWLLHIFHLQSLLLGGLDLELRFQECNKD
ncbi:hypothetical protein LguiB_016200 [Lonicera macranthoides]